MKIYVRGTTQSNAKLLDQLNEKFEMVKKDSRKIDLELEDSMSDDVAELFRNEFGAEVSESSYREHGWYYRKFTLNGKPGTLYYHPLDNSVDIGYNKKCLSKDNSGFPIEEAFNRFHKLLDTLG